jgi:VCBS repeat-containing protein
VPVARNDSYSVDEDRTLTVDAPGVLANDTDVEGASLQAILVSNPTHGDVTLNTNGSFIYTPDANYQGTDTFTYRAREGEAGLQSNVATVTITIDPAQPGDVNGDGCVDDADLSAIVFAFGNTGSGLPEDLNGDGEVNDADLSEVIFHFGEGC